MRLEEYHTVLEDMFNYPRLTEILCTTKMYIKLRKAAMETSVKSPADLFGGIPVKHKPIHGDTLVMVFSDGTHKYHGEKEIAERLINLRQREREVITK